MLEEKSDNCIYRVFELPDTCVNIDYFNIVYFDLDSLFLDLIGFLEMYQYFCESKPEYRYMVTTEFGDREYRLIIYLIKIK